MISRSQQKILVALILCVSLLAATSACGVNTQNCDGLVNVNSCNSTNTDQTSNTNNGQTNTTNNTASIPPLASIYQGTFTNLSLHATSTLALTSITQKQNQISGHISWGPGWIGNGPFAGTIESNRNVHFSDEPTDGGHVSIFSGSLRPDGSLGGTYTVPSLNYNGTWNTKPST